MKTRTISSQGYPTVARFNDHPEREYTGSPVEAPSPWNQGEDMVSSAVKAVAVASVTGRMSRILLKVMAIPLMALSFSSAVLNRYKLA